LQIRYIGYGRDTLRIGEFVRKELKKIDGQRDVFIGTFVREGIKSSYKGASLSTLLFKEVKRVSDNKLMCDHLWLNKTKALSELNLSTGIQIQFAARVKEYTKGYLGKKEDIKKEIKQDFKLSHPTQVEALGSSKIKESKFIIRRAK